jgi:hypothetical protein
MQRVIKKGVAMKFFKFFNFTEEQEAHIAPFVRVLAFALVFLLFYITKK